MKIEHLLPQFKRYFLYEKGRKSKSYKSVIATLNQFMDLMDVSDTSQLNVNTLRNFLNIKQEQQQWSPKTFRNQRQCLKSFIDWCVKERIIKNNPVENIGKPKLKKLLPRYITKTDIYKILACLDRCSWQIKFQKVRNSAIINTFLLTGLRLQELINLESFHVNLKAKEIFVSLGKGGKDRMVPIHPALYPILRDYLTYKKQNNINSIWFFPSVRSSKKLTNKNVYAFFKEISRISGVYVTPHMLRHSFAKFSIEGDLNLYKLKEIMGHERIYTTQRYISIAGESTKRSFFNIDLI